MPRPSGRVGYAAFWAAKAGNDAADYEDAFAGDPAVGRFAVADGATESSFAAEWARLLAEDFVACRTGGADAWLKRLPAVQEQWWAVVGPKSLPWYAEAKREEGAFATFLGLV